MYQPGTMDGYLVTPGAPVHQVNAPPWEAAAAAARAAAPVEWGEAVHGSSAFLQAMGQAPQPASNTSLPGPQQVHPHAMHGGQPAQQHAYASSCPDIVSGNLQGNAQQHLWIQGTAATGLTASLPHLQHSASASNTNWQPPSNPRQHPGYDQHHHPQQYAWKSYHGHSAMTEGETAVTGGAVATDSWKGWASYSGARPQEPPAPAAACSNGFAFEGSSYAMAAAVAALHTSAAGGGSDEMYDPMAHADTPMETVIAAAAAVTTAVVSSEATPGGVKAATAAPDNDTVRTAAVAIDRMCGTSGVAPAVDQSVATAVDLVVVWDLDETLIIFNSLLSGAFARAAIAAAGASAAAAAPTVAASCEQSAASTVACGGAEGASELLVKAAELGQQLAQIVFSFCDNHMAFRKLDDIDPLCFAELWAQTTVAAAQEQADTDSNASPAASTAAAAGIVDRATLERIAELYGGGAGALPGAIGEADCRALAEALAEAECLTGGWVAAARRLLGSVSAAVAGDTPAGVAPPLVFRNVRHVLVSAGHLVATLGKLMLWGLDQYFDIRDVYSASGRSKLDVFRSLRARLGPNSAYAAVGDGLEEERAAAVLGWGFVRVALTDQAETAAGGELPPSAEASVAAAGAGERSGSPLAGPESLLLQPWQLPRPVPSIRAEDVLSAAREAY